MSLVPSSVISSALRDPLPPFMGRSFWLWCANVRLSPFSFQRVQFVSDPCSLSVNGVVLGLTSTDLLFHMGAEEISR